jgi:hypothetical protein
MDSPSFGANTILHRLQQEDTIVQAHAAQSGTNPTTLAAVCRDKLPCLCSNCKKEGHLMLYCIKPGGGMAGKSLNEACTTQCNARQNGHSGDGNSSQAPAASANVATSASPMSQPDRMVTINSQTFILTPATTAPASVNTAVAISDMVFPSNVSDYDTISSSFTLSVNIAIAPPSSLLGPSVLSDTDSAIEDMPPHEHCEYEAYIAVTGLSHTSINWRSNLAAQDTLGTAISPVAYMASCPPISHLGSIPFILDSGTNCYISPEHGDFKSLNPIPPLTVKGFGGSSIQAIGMGTIEVYIASGLCLSLTNILFICNSKICLLSVSSLNRSSNYITHLHSASCWVTNHSGATIIRGALSPNRHLYMVALTSASIA